MSDWKDINLGTNHKLGIDAMDKKYYEVAVFIEDKQVTKAISYDSYFSFGTLSTFPQFGLTVKIRKV